MGEVEEPHTDRPEQPPQGWADGEPHQQQAGTARAGGSHHREPQSAGVVVLAGLLTLGLPFIMLYSFVAAFASDPCSSDVHTGICDPRLQNLAVFVPVVGWIIAVAAAWILIAALPRRRMRARAVAVCWIAAVGCLLYSMSLISQVPG
jgi:hypothetical protein